jgi:hypothetical protein
MKKIFISLFSALLTLSCILQMFNQNTTSIPTPTLTNTLTLQPTLTPVTPTLTFTFTPTLSGVRTSTTTPEVTQTSTANNVTPFVLFTPGTSTPIFNMQGFVFVTASIPEFYKGTGCQPSSVRITAQAGLSDTTHVLLFVRFKSLQSERVSLWTTIDMQTIGAGTYVHDLISTQMKEDQFFQNAWVEYQIVATNSAGKEIGRTDIFKEKVKMSTCVPTLPSTPPTVKP